MLSALLSTIVPTFGIIGIGWLARHVRIWNGSSVAVLNNYAYYIALPALIFLSIIESNLGATFTSEDGRLLVGVIAAHLLVFVAILPFLRVKKISEDTRATLPMLLTFGSTAYLGIPYATFAFGREGTVYASLLSVVLVIVLIFTSILVLNRFTHRRVHRSAVRTMLELPFLWAVIAALLWPILSLPALPDFLARFINILSDSAGPTALLGLGTFLFDIRLKEIPWGSALAASLGKVILPTTATYLILQALGVGGVRLAVGVAMGGVSTAVTAFILAGQYKLGERLTAGTILLSTFCSLIMLGVISALSFGTSIFGI